MSDSDPPAVEPVDDDRRAPLQPLTHSLRRAGKVAGAAMVLIGVVGLIWRTVVFVDDVYETIHDNAKAVREMREANRQAHREMRDDMRAIIEATQRAREKDREAVQSLRVAIAAMYAADQVRHGNASYSGTGFFPGAGSSPDSPLAAIEEQERPSPRERDEQITLAHEDAMRALQAAEESDDTDPLAGIRISAE